jgi:tripartite-type tricarboxylate transporter receptor subunit TctC
VIVRSPPSEAGSAIPFDAVLLLAGQVQVSFPPMVVAIAQVKAGKLRALAVTTATRSEALPDIPAVGEFVPGYEASVWFGLGAPNGTPAEIINMLNQETNAALADQDQSTDS